MNAVSFILDLSQSFSLNPSLKEGIFINLNLIWLSCFTSVGFEVLATFYVLHQAHHSVNPETAAFICLFNNIRNTQWPPKNASDEVVNPQFFTKDIFFIYIYKDFCPKTRTFRCYIPSSLA